jgi:pilus assembly protein Flp/PilA
MRGLIRRFLRAEDGTTAIEYAMLVALIALAIATTVNNIGSNVKGMFDKAVASFPAG